jgi:hypothetical protein
MANIKDCFYTILAHLKQRQEHFARVALGASCEAWLNAESFVALNWAVPPILGTNEQSWPEHRKRDLTIAKPVGGGEEPCLSQIVEVKVLYPWPDGKLRGDKLDVLRSQLDRVCEPDDLGARRIGLMFAIWTSAYTEVPDAFFGRLSRLSRDTFPDEEYTTQHAHVFERFARDQKTQLGGEQFTVHAGASYVTKRAS